MTPSRGVQTLMAPATLMAPVYDRALDGAGLQTERLFFFGLRPCAAVIGLQAARQTRIPLYSFTANADSIRP
jgi:hypothetical protein